MTEYLKRGNPPHLTWNVRDGMDFSFSLAR